jgi:hypothetical protein
MPRTRQSLAFLCVRLAACVALAVAAWGLAEARAQAPTPMRQVDLTVKQIEGFIAAQKPMTEVTERMQGSVADNQDPKIQAELEAVAKKSGFKDFSEYDEVATTIAMVMAGIDPETRRFTQPDDAIRREIAELQADKSLPADERKQALDELNEALKSAQPIRNPANIELVKKYYDKIEAALE